MRIVPDTNVFISGVFWKGPPSTVLDACSKGQVDLVLSPVIIEEYRRVGHDLADRYRSLDLDPIIDALVTAGSVVSDHELIARVCSDPDDDKFLAAAVAVERRSSSAATRPCCVSANTMVCGSQAPANSLTATSRTDGVPGELLVPR